MCAACEKARQAHTISEFGDAPMRSPWPAGAENGRARTRRVWTDAMKRKRIVDGCQFLKRAAAVVSSLTLDTRHGRSVTSHRPFGLARLAPLLWLRIRGSYLYY